MAKVTEGNQYDAAAARSSVPRGRSHWAWPWLLLILALPGAAWSLYVVAMTSMSFFGERPSPTERANAAAAALSGVSLWLTTGLLTAVVFRRVVVSVLCGLGTVYFTALANPVGEPRALLSTAGSAEWLSAWTPPTSWVIGLWVVVTLVRSTYLRLRKGPALDDRPPPYGGR